MFRIYWCYRWKEFLFFACILFLDQSRSKWDAKGKTEHAKWTWLVRIKRRRAAQSQIEWNMRTLIRIFSLPFDKLSHAASVNCLCVAFVFCPTRLSNLKSDAESIRDENDSQRHFTLWERFSQRDGGPLNAVQLVGKKVRNRSPAFSSRCSPI